MTLSNKIIDDLKAKSGLLLEQAKDLDVLAGDIFSVTNRNIGITTLKRLLGIITDNHKTNQFTLNTLAIYLGYKTWEDYIAATNIDSVWNFDDQAIYVSDLKENSTVSVKYLDRHVSFKVTTYEDSKVLKVVSTENSSLQPDNVVVIHKLCLGEIMQAEGVIRNGVRGNYKTGGELSEIIVSD